MSYYAVANGRIPGIFRNWKDCSNSVKGYKNAQYKKFNTIEDANKFIQTINININKSNIETPAIDFIPDYYVYTDGACSNNGKKNALAGFGIYFGPNDIRNVSKKIEGKQSNNIAELTAIKDTYDIIKTDIINGKKIAIVSDSEYSIKCVSSYGEKCHKKNWNVEIPNKELVKYTYEIYKEQQNIQFIHIKAHTGNTDIHSIGNENADKLANIAIGLESCPYTSI
jgi:ribonuclease HI